VLGDSIGFGYCNDDEPLAIKDTFAAVLEASLRERIGPHVEVINLSVSGYDTLQEAELLARKGVALGPDVVLIAYCLNDAWQSSQERLAFQRGGFAELLGRSDAFRRLYLSSHLMRLSLQRTQLLWRGVRKLRRELEGDRTEEGFARVAQLAEEHRFATVVATFPLFQDFADYPRLAEHDVVASRSRAQKFHHLDLLPAFRAASQDDASAVQGRCSREHPDERGHLVAARAIEEYLIANGLVTPPAR